MSAPTKGMVAGQPIQTGAQTKEFDEGYERIFGKDRTPQRGRYVWDAELGKCVRVDDDWTDATVRAQTATEGIVYGSTVAPDGTDISTRRKRRDYMKRNGLSDAADFKEHWAKAAKHRAAVASGDADTKERREIIGRALYEARKKKPTRREPQAPQRATAGWTDYEE